MKVIFTLFAMVLLASCSYFDKTASVEENQTPEIQLAAPVMDVATCAKQDEANALNVRALQSSLMVAALSCGQSNEYNKFVKKNKKSFLNGSKGVKAYFQRLYGNSYEKEMNVFATKLANDASKVSMNNDDNYCAQTAHTFSRLQKLKGDKAITNFARKKETSYLHGIAACNG